MNESIQIALVSMSGAVIVASINSAWMWRAFNRMEKRIDSIEADLKDFFRITGEHHGRIAVVEEKTRDK